MRNRQSVIVSMVAAAGLAGTLSAQSTVFGTNEPDLRMAAASRLEGATAVEVETADDFVLGTDTRLSGAKFIGLIPSGAALTDVRQVSVQIYRIFPFDSNTARVPQVPTRTNSPADVALQSRGSDDLSLTFSAAPFHPSVTALNSVVNGINPSPNQTTQGEGPVLGEATTINVEFVVPIDLPPGHYFFVPQVALKAGTFHWLTSPKPIAAPGTPFATDLQAWIRSGRLNPDWLRIGTDIVGGSPAPAFNMSFALRGSQQCYANCDGSTGQPVLNVLDFTCFLNRFAAGLPEANCDNSTTSPVLNVLDFVCFLNRFAAGCS